jgi:hypothetical protein
MADAFAAALDQPHRLGLVLSPKIPPLPLSVLLHRSLFRAYFRLFGVSIKSGQVQRIIDRFERQIKKLS